MKHQKFNKQFAKFFGTAVNLFDTGEADGLLVMLDGPTDWERLREVAGDRFVLVAADHEDELAGAAEFDLKCVTLGREEAPVFEKLTQALLEGVADDLLLPSADVIAVYSGFEAGKIDSISYIHLDEHLGRLTSRDLQNLETSVPLETLKSVVDLAVDIGREGREGKTVGTMFIVGDTRKVLNHC
ncbi:MAG: hypothetical protein QF805_04405, partial [Pirellulaceae bacterium]|nr:hypothetical protein [Pirellulaceae bacterium]